eukprot:3564988-Pyramimonas_sp.AAC.1
MHSRLTAPPSSRPRKRARMVQSAPAEALAVSQRPSWRRAPKTVSQKTDVRVVIFSSRGSLQAKALLQGGH